MNILLICSAGMSTSMVVKKMQSAAEQKGIEATIWAVGDAETKDNIAKADVIMLGPQVRFMKEKIEGQAGGKPVLVIDMMDYGRMNGEKILEDALSAGTQ